MAGAKLGAPAGPVSLGAPLPAPVESTTPDAYETPGLAAATAADGSSDSVIAARKAAAANPVVAEPAVPVRPLPPTFIPKGTVYGAQPGASAVTVQALKGGSLIVRGAGGVVYFARQLAAGEAYRVPNLGGLTIDTTDAHAFQVFVDGQSKGLLPSPTVSPSKLTGG